MKKALLKTAFIASVFVLTLVLLFPANLLLDAVLAGSLDPKGRLRRIDTLLPGIVLIFACLAAANRITSSIFWSAHLSGERWSIFEDRRRRRSG